MLYGRSRVEVCRRCGMGSREERELRGGQLMLKRVVAVENEPWGVAVGRRRVCWGSLGLRGESGRGGGDEDLQLVVRDGYSAGSRD